MNTTTMRIDQYLHDDEEHYAAIVAFVTAVAAKEDRFAQVSAWLRQHFSGGYDHLDEQYIDWEELAQGFVIEIAPIADENLPRLVVALANAARWIEDEIDGQARASGPVAHAIQALEKWKQEWRGALSTSSTSISYVEFLHRCRQAPPIFLLEALIATCEALQSCAEEAGDVPFWNEGGTGWKAHREGSQAIQSTWWSFQPFLREWANAYKLHIRHVLDVANDALTEQAARQESFGVIEPGASSLRDLRAYVFGAR